MPTEKHKEKAQTVKKPIIVATTEPSYDTKLIIVVLLLVFTYPLGLIFMWFWMKSWPVWLKLVISIPFIIGFVFFLTMLSFIWRMMRDNGEHPYVRNNMRYEIQVKPTLNYNPPQS